jgi:serine/threonine protein phosphatase PrpC
VTFTTSLIVQSANPECQVRAEVIPASGRAVLVLADGAGGISGGAHAAERFVNWLREAEGKLQAAEDCIRLLEAVDREMARHKPGGETAGMVVIVDSSRIFGASVGDATAWFFTNEGAGELTYGQQHQPLLGSGAVATPRGFSWPVEDGTVVAASDGLWNYTNVAAVSSRVRTRDSEDLAPRLAELARLRSGTFPDDVAIVTCRLALAEFPARVRA